jgi:hypothetical protein
MVERRKADEFDGEPLVAPRLQQMATGSLRHRPSLPRSPAKLFGLSCAHKQSSELSPMVRRCLSTWA